MLIFNKTCNFNIPINDLKSRLRLDNEWYTLFRWGNYCFYHAENITPLKIIKNSIKKYACKRKPFGEYYLFFGGKLDGKWIKINGNNEPFYAYGEIYTKHTWLIGTEFVFIYAECDIEKQHIIDTIMRTN
ncbi:MAG: hypothetical protein ACFFG0_37325 [Candidatus Thorarchaeota archaeon]